jgi:uracil-DNA glycosylase family 4
MTELKTKRGKKVVKIPPPNVLESFQGTKQERLQQLYSKWYGCLKCPLGELRACDGKQDIVFGHGNPDAHILIVGEAPGEEEEATSVPFVGKAGQLLNQILAFTSSDPEIREAQEAYSRKSHSDYNQKKIRSYHDFVEEWRFNEFFLTNAVACRPPENATPTTEQIKQCWDRLWNIIYIVDPWLIIACGNSALSALMRKVQVKITAARGRIYDVEFEGHVGPVTYPIVPIFHPSYLLRKADYEVQGGDYEKTVKDLRMALKAVDFLRSSHLDIPIPTRG